MLDAAFVESIKGLADRAAKVEVIDGGENERLVMAGGKVVERFQRDEPFGKLVVAEFSSFVDAALNLVPKAEESIIAVTNKGCVLTCDGPKPHKKAVVELIFKPTAAYEALINWEENPKSVSAINKLLRTKLYNTFDDKLLAIFKQVEFSRSGATTVAKQAHRDTMGKTVDNAVRSLHGELPEVISFNTALISNAPTEIVTLRYAVDADYDKETIAIAPMGDIVTDSMRDTVQDLVLRLKQELPAALVVAS